MKKGDRVAIYMPMIPELPVAMLACTRIGAPHSVVFGGFSADALADRIDDAECSVVITADGGYRKGATVALKKSADEAIGRTSSVKHCVVVKRTGDEVAWDASRDHWYHELIADQPTTADPEPMEAEDLLYLLYTSGTTAKPKGIMHTTGGYLAGVSATHRYIFDLHPETDVYWCMADIGWVTGHSYIVYGPLANATTGVIYEGAIDFPDKDRWAQVAAKYAVTILYTAPTAIRALMKYGHEQFADDDLSSLRLLGSVGEPINPEAWAWYWKYIGGGRCPVVDTWWQTETGMIMLTPLPGVTTLKPGSATFPFPGVKADVVDEAGYVRSARWRRVPRARAAVARDAARHLRRPGAISADLLVALPGALLPRRRLQARRGGLLLAPRPRRRRDERVGAPHLDDRGGVRARLASLGGRGRGGRSFGPDHRPGDLQLRDPAIRVRGVGRAGRRSCASTSPT